MELDAFSPHFGEIKDPRQSAKISYPLFDVLFLTMCAVLTGAEGWEDIEDFGNMRRNWLQEKGFFQTGLPVHDTIVRIISRLDPVQFQHCFIRWTQAVSERTDGEIIAIDGKALRGTGHWHKRLSAIHMVSAFATANGVVMGQLKTEKKSNEITAIPKLIDLLDIRGCWVTLDALGCQTKIAQKIIAQGGDYLLAVKENQATLHRAIKQTLSAQVTAVSQSEHVNIEQGHGRIELREYHVLPAGELASQFPEWKGLKSVGVAIRYRFDKTRKKESLDYHYYISSAELNSDRFGAAVRGHWGIENRVHWVLDVSMNEDACAIRRGNAAEILAGMRHFSLNMLRAETSVKDSIRRKTNMANMSSEYLDKVFIAGFQVLGKK
ncbi:ISAs1 family transposase [Xenorhabdus littoralis]|uniref:ISAs1 family transposase n=1 Tax=Xenorhabdus littoralis TaxID=2582835 RepID=UPI0029E7F637|nr:ISAs1 family transposase [Xenorhabdus sp. psl]MDX7990834.1 ISAs1 family transposase [Xenorhabdus sp. psl]